MLEDARVEVRLQIEYREYNSDRPVISNMLFSPMR
jgi:hypothetical protein